MMSHFLAGAASMASLIISLFFIRFWRKTRDRLFLFFAAAFALLMAERIIRSSLVIDTEVAPYVYIVRLIAFGLIIVAIIDKNRRS
ncbi:MAG TPA: DUF5985 family protein [Chthoniobacteraceae bacterium]|jgi:hypothetical protein